MADYRLSQSGDEVQDILTNSASRSLIEQEAERAAGAEQTLQQNIDAEALARQGADTTLQQNIDAETLARQGADTTLQQNIDAEAQARQQGDTTLQQNLDTEEARAKAAELAEKNRAEAAENAINAKIPAAASAQNQLADKAFVNSSIATAAATFRGSYNLVSDMHLTVSATRLQIAAALSDVIAEADNNDYCFVMIPTADATPTEIASIERYKYNGSAWAFEYALNNSGFTAAQWAALNSGITSGLVAKLTALPTAASLSTSLAALQQDIDDEETRAKGVEQTIAGNLSAEITRAQGAEGTLQGNIDAEALARQQADTALQNADTALGGRVTTIEGKIPVAASSSNQLADKDFVNSSIQTNTAEFKGSFNEVTDLNLTTSATRADIIAALPGVISSANNNDYCYVQIPTADATPTEIASVERYKYSGSAWAFEYALNNSGFTAAQWAALNSGINSGLVSKLSALPTNSELVTLLGGKQDVISDLSTIRSGAAAGATAYQKPQTGIPSTDMSDAVQTSLGKADAAAPQSTTYTKTEVDGLVGAEETRAQAAEGGLQDDIDAIEAKIPVAASSSNQLADKDFVNSGIATATATFRGSYNLVSDLSLTTSATEQQIATALAGEISTADNNDYCFVQIPTADDTPTVIARVDRYKYNGTAWSLEYTLNNSGFTAAQWDALNSGITSGLVTKLTTLPTNAELTTLLNGKQDVIADLSTIRSGAAAGATAYQKPSSGIPSTDMTEAVQTSLGKADTALQEHQSLADYYTKQQTNAQINSAVATATATYRGSYNLVTDLGLTVGATESQIAAALAGEISTADNNDYCFVQVPVATDTPTVIGSVDRYKFDGTDWSFEYSLNNSGFTAAQWAALNSGITSGLVTKLTALPTNSELTTLLGGKQDVIADLAAIRLGAQAGATAYQKPATGIPDTDFTAELQAAIASFITKAVNDLTNYYLKSETYTKTEVDALVAAIQQFTLVSVQTLPTASAGTMNKIYLVPSSNPQTQNVKDEFITLMTDEQGTVTYSWECIGSTEVNLTNYYTKTQTDTQIASALNNALAAYSTTTQVGTMISSAINSALAAYATKEYVSSQVQEYAGTFRGTYDTIADLEATTGNHHNDYAWVKVTDSDGDNDYDRYKYNGSAWVFEYRLNNTHFTADELASIRSGMTTAKREKLDALPTNSELTTTLNAMTRHTRLTDFDLNVLKQAVADQNLEKYGLKVGDQKTINGYTYIIADLNTMKGTATPYRVTANHVGMIVIPHTTTKWNASGNTSTGANSRGAGYKNCDLHDYLKTTVLPHVQTDLGAANLIAHSKLLTNAVNTTGYNRYGTNTGCSSDWEWVTDQYICALSEVQVYGATVWSSSGYDTGEACRQLEVFQHYSHTEIFGGEYPWLRDVVSASYAAYADGTGTADHDPASLAYYVAALILFH